MKVNRIHFATLIGAAASGIASTALAQPPNQPSQPAWTVETVVVTGERQSYSAADALSATKTPSPLIETPQSIQVLNRTLIEEQDRRTIADAAANISGVIPAKTEEAVLAQPIVRGFASEVFVDGLPAYGGTDVANAASLINVERLEVAKGPTAALYGGGVGAPLGGLINLVSKAPTSTFGGFISLRGGSYSTFNPSFDVNAPLSSDGRVAARLTGEYQSGDSHIDQLENERIALYPTFRFNLGDRTDITLRGQYSKIEQLEYSGLPAAVTVSGSARADRYHFSGASDAPETTIENKLLTADVTHRFSDGVQGRLTARYYDSDFKEYASFIFPSFYPPAPTTPTRYPLLTGYLPTKTKEYTVDGNILAQVNALGVKHQLLFGATYDKTDYDAAIGFNFFPIGVIDYANPASDVKFGAVPALSGSQTDQYETLAGYVQDQFAIGEKLHVTGSLRYTRLSIRQKEAKVDRDYFRVTPRIGATFDVAPGVAMFAGYSEGFRATLNLTSSRPPVPETSQGYEAGVKLAMKPMGLSGTIALFELKRQNVPTADPAVPFASIQTGEQRSRGAEADVIWEPSQSISVLANYAYTEAKVTKDNSIPVGDGLPRIPTNSGRIAARYRFLSGGLKGLSLGGGVSALSRRELTLPNSVTAPGYAVVDAQASYDFDRYTLGLSLVNLTDRKAFDPYQYLAQAVVIPIQSRSAFATLKARF